MKSAKELFEDLGYKYKKQKKLYLESIIYEKGSKRVRKRFKNIEKKWNYWLERTIKIEL